MDFCAENDGSLCAKSIMKMMGLTVNMMDLAHIQHGAGRHLAGDRYEKRCKIGENDGGFTLKMMDFVLNMMDYVQRDLTVAAAEENRPLASAGELCIKNDEFCI